MQIQDSPEMGSYSVDGDGIVRQGDTTEAIIYQSEPAREIDPIDMSDISDALSVLGTAVLIGAAVVGPFFVHRYNKHAAARNHTDSPK